MEKNTVRQGDWELGQGQCGLLFKQGWSAVAAFSHIWDPPFILQKDLGKAENKTSNFVFFISTIK